MVAAGRRRDGAGWCARPRTASSCSRPDLEKAITPKTKWIILCSPSNPTGLRLFAQGAEGDHRRGWSSIRHVWVMTDDMYEHLVYDDFRLQPRPAQQIEPKLYGPHIDGERRLQGLLHDGLAHRLLPAVPAELIKAMATIQSQSDLEPLVDRAMGFGRKP